jgi:hypothetical protein
MRAFIIGILLASPFGANAQTALVGKWQVNWEETLSHAPSAEVARFEKYDEILREQVRAGMEGRHYAFENNGEVTITSGARMAQGIWTFEGSVLAITVGNSTRNYQVVFIDNNMLTLEMTAAPDMILFSRPVLKRIP